MKKLIMIIVVMLMATSCMTDSKMASNNLSKAAEMFQIARRVVFYNGVTGDYILTIEGLCSVDENLKKLSVTCKIGEGLYKKHYLGLSDNVTYFAEQLNAKAVSVYHHKVIFKPQSIIPNIDFKASFWWKWMSKKNIAKLPNSE